MPRARVSADAQLRTAESFHAASFGLGSWTDALLSLAKLTGSRGGELIGLGSRNSVPFNWAAGMDPEWQDEFRAIDGGNPKVNPYVRAGSRAAPLSVLSSAEFVTRKERRESAFLAEHCITFDIPHICLSPLIKSEEMLIGLAVMRSRTQGEIKAAERAAFAATVPHIHAAVRAQLALEHQGASVMAGVLEAASITAFVCNWVGVVKAMTPSAEALVAAGTKLQLRTGLLCVDFAGESRDLASAMRRAAYDPLGFAGSAASTIVLRQGLTSPLILEVLPVPRRDNGFTFDPRVVVIVRDGPSRAERLCKLLSMAYGLTRAEVEVTTHLMEGDSPAEIALKRGVSVGTVRYQVQSVFSKLQIHSIGDLLAVVSKLG